MDKVRRVLTVFLASPSDVREERLAAGEIIQWIDKNVGRSLGSHIELSIWEDTLPGYGRPQALINQQVDECDLFIGLLWERWGGATGTHSSGFYEEYERAMARREKTGSPPIWLFFKEPGSHMLKDPGEQLKRVIAFRDEQQRSNKVLYKTISDIADWRDKLQGWLTQHVIRFSQEELDTPDRTSPVLQATESRSSGPVDTSPITGNSLAAAPQILTVSKTLYNSLQAEGMETLFGAEGALTEFEAVRLMLLSHTVMSRRYTAETIGTHELNILYKHRLELEAAEVEKIELLRSIVEESSSVRPGWFWFKDWPSQELLWQLISLCTGDASVSVRARSLRVLAEAKVQVKSELWPMIPISDESPVVRKAAFAYIATQESQETLEFFEKQKIQIVDLDILSELEHARFIALTRCDPDQAWTEFLDADEDRSNDDLKSLVAQVERIGPSVLWRGTKSSKENLQKASLKELVRRSGVSVEEAQVLSSNSSRTVRAFGFQVLAQKGELPDVEIVRDSLKLPEDGPESATNLGLLAGWGGEDIDRGPDTESIAIAFYETQDVQTVRDAVDWYSLSGRMAYRALASKRFLGQTADFRTDLIDKFESIREKSLLKFAEKYSIDPDTAKEELSTFDDFLESSFVEAALIGIANAPEATDLKLARPYLSLNYSDAQRLAVKIVSAVGNEDDSATLLEIAKNTYGRLQNDAVVGALKLAANPIMIAKELLQDKDSEVRKLAYQWLVTEDSAQVKEVFQELLFGKSSTGRMRAVTYFNLHGSRDTLEDLLNSYLARTSYHYDVVAALDRLLYAPNELGGMVVREIEESI